MTGIYEVQFYVTRKIPDGRVTGETLKWKTAAPGTEEALRFARDFAANTFRCKYWSIDSCRMIKEALGTGG